MKKKLSIRRDVLKQVSQDALKKVVGGDRELPGSRCNLSFGNGR